MTDIRYDYLLPIGSIVKVANFDQKLMIYGVLQEGAAAPGHTFDYVAVPYPGGLYDMRLNIGFDHSDIEEIIFRGYEDQERKSFLIVLEAMARKYEQVAEQKNE